MKMPEHKRLSQALCEAVKYGRPTAIRMGFKDFDQLFYSIGPGDMQKLVYSIPEFEGVRVVLDREITGCIVEHDSRYCGPLASGVLCEGAPMVTVAVKDYTHPPIQAW